MKNKHEWFIQLFCTKIGWVFISMICVVVFGCLSPYGILSEYGADWCLYPMLAGLVYLLGISLIMIAYAWVINPINSYKERKKEKSKK